MSAALAGDLTRRHLLAEAKADELAKWEADKSRPRPPGDVGGHGWADTEIVPLCDALNALPGICTLQSCAGHRDSVGHLWLWLDEQNAGAFDRWGYVLARMRGIEVVSRKYTDWGQEITAIEFDGRFEVARDSVLLFFSALTLTYDSRRPDPSPDTGCRARR